MSSPLETQLWLIALYAASLLLPAALVLFTAWRAWIKTALILAVGLALVAQFEALQRFAGWPADVPLPERFLFHSALIEEPDKKSGTSGRIELWVSAVSDDGPAALPRAYHLPYSVRHHREIEAARARLRNGVTQLGRAEPEAPAATLPSGEARAATAVRLSIEDLPAPALPEK